MAVPHRWQDRGRTPRRRRCSSFFDQVSVTVPPKLSCLLNFSIQELLIYIYIYICIRVSRDTYNRRDVVCRHVKHAQLNDGPHVVVSLVPRPSPARARNVTRKKLLSSGIREGLVETSREVDVGWTVMRTTGRKTLVSERTVVRSF